MARVDDPAFFAPFAPCFHPVPGRQSTPIECYLRLMFLKFRHRLGYESLCRGERADRERGSGSASCRCHTSFMQTSDLHDQAACRAHQHRDFACYHMSHKTRQIRNTPEPW
jgi:hypothetical protein